MKQILANHKGFVKVFWNDNPEIEEKIKEETKAVSRCCIATDQSGTDFYTGEPATEVWLFAQSY
jgi:prolyl-tRNA synthetase